jgi:hypothetical protein
MQYPIQLNVDRPEKLSRLTSFFRIIMVIPQMVVMYFLAIAAGVILFLSWWAILFTGRIPRSFFDYLAWYMRWSIRVSGYLYLLTDKYPPFSGQPSTPMTPPAASPK